MEPKFCAYLELGKKERRENWNRSGCLALFLGAGTRAYFRLCPISGSSGQDTCVIWDEPPVPDGKPARKGVDGLNI